MLAELPDIGRVGPTEKYWINERLPAKLGKLSQVVKIKSQIILGNKGSK